MGRYKVDKLQKNYYLTMSKKQMNTHKGLWRQVVDFFEYVLSF